MTSSPQTVYSLTALVRSIMSSLTRINIGAGLRNSVQTSLLSLSCMIQNQEAMRGVSIYIHLWTFFMGYINLDRRLPSRFVCQFESAPGLSSTTKHWDAISGHLRGIGEPGAFCFLEGLWKSVDHDYQRSPVLEECVSYVSRNDWVLACFMGKHSRI